MFSAKMEASFDQFDPYLMIAVSGRLDTLYAPQFDEKLESFVGDAVLRVIQEKALRLNSHPLTALGIICEKFS